MEAEPRLKKRKAPTKKAAVAAADAEATVPTMTDTQARTIDEPAPIQQVPVEELAMPAKKKAKTAKPKKTKVVVVLPSAHIAVDETMQTEDVADVVHDAAVTAVEPTVVTVVQPPLAVAQLATATAIVTQDEANAQKRKRGRKSNKEIEHEERQRQAISLASHAHLLDVSAACAMAPMVQIYLLHPNRYELEARLGEFQHSTSSFKGGITRDFFQAMLKIVNGDKDAWDKNEPGTDPWQRSIDVIYINGVRETKHYDNHMQRLLRTTFQFKERVCDLDFVHLLPNQQPPVSTAATAPALTNILVGTTTAEENPSTLAGITTTAPTANNIPAPSAATDLYDLRVSLKREETLHVSNALVQELKPKKIAVECVRSKWRQSFVSQHRGFKVDFTIVWTGRTEERVLHPDNKDKAAFEIEIECMPTLFVGQGNAAARGPALMENARRWMHTAQRIIGSDQPVHLLPIGA